MTKDLVKKEVKSLRRWDVKFKSENKIGGDAAGLSSLPTLPSLIREGGAPTLMTDFRDLYHDSYSEAVRLGDPSLSLRMTEAEESRKNFQFSIFNFQLKNAAFTLAEVLITLGVIGVVAAMTMPVLITKYQKMQTVNKLKKVYTTLNQAMKLSEAENGEYVNWESGAAIGADAYFEKYWKPYLNVAKICKTYADCGYSSNQPYTYLNSNIAGTNIVYSNYRVPFILSDGILINIFTVGGGVETGNIFVDLNAGRGENRFGKDVFIFTRDSKGQIYPYCYDKSYSYINAYCQGTGDGQCCAAKIMKDDWKMDY